MPFDRVRKPTVWQQQPVVDFGHPINRGLVLFYPLSETGGTIAREIGPTRSMGTLVNYTTSTPVAGPIQSGTALSFNGSNQYVSGPTNVPLGGTSVVSISLWLYFVSQGSFATLISKNAGSNDSSQWDWGLLFPSGGGTTLFLCRNGANNTPAGAVTTNGWMHVGAVISDVESLLYLNGVSTTSQGGVGTGATQNTAGRAVTLMGESSGGAVNGRLSNVRVFNRKLTQTEFYSLYSQPLLGLLSPRQRLPAGAATAVYKPRLVRWST
jgi:hypothetical protein